MIDAKVADAIRSRIGGRMLAQKRDEVRALQELNAELSMTSSFRASRALLVITALFEQHLVQRTEIIWDEATRTADLLIEPYAGFAFDLNEHAQRWITSCAAELARDLGAELLRHDGTNGLVTDQCVSRLVAIGAGRSEFYASEAPLFVAKHNRDHEARQREKAGALHVHGNFYGAVQMGAGSVANVSVQIDQGARESMRAALDAIEAQLDRVDTVGGLPSAEVLRVVEDVRIETEQQTPNRLRLTSLLMGLAVTIQTAATMKPAYELLRVASAAALNVHLPPFPL